MPHPWDLPRPAHLVLFLADARRQGAPFADAWCRAMAIVCGSARERDWWLTAFAQQREAWRRAYEGEPAADWEVELGDLAPELVGDLDDGAGQQACAHCEGPLPEGMKATALYCGPGCKRAAAYERERRISQPRTPAVGRLERKGPTARDGDGIDHVALEAA